MSPIGAAAAGQSGPGGPAHALPVARFTLGAPAVWIVPAIAAAAVLLFWLGHWNEAVFRVLNGWGLKTGDLFWANVTVLGDTVVALALCLPLWHRRPDVLWALALGSLFATAWVHVLKPVLDMPRPPGVLGDAVHVIGPTILHRSFPSGHATTSFLVAGLIAMGLNTQTATARGLGALAVMLALLAAASRSVVGVHWPADVAAGAFGGWLAAAFGLALARRTLHFGLRPAVQRVMGAVLTGCAVALVIGYPDEYPQARLLQACIGGACLASAALALWQARGAPGRGC